MGMMWKPEARRRCFFQGALWAVLVVALPGCDLLTISQSGRNLRAGNEAISRGEVHRAVQYYETALDGTMISAEAHYRLGLVYEDEMQNQIGALHHFERYLELAPQGQFATDVHGYVDRLRLVMVSQLADGAMLPAKEGARLKNENLKLRQQLTQLRSQATRPLLRMTPVPTPTPTMVVAATPPPFPVRAATPVSPEPEVEVRRALPVYRGTGAVPAAAPVAVASPQSYTVVSGDTLVSIAKKFYKKPNSWPRIAEANKHVFSDPTKLKPGMVLTIP